MIDSYINQYGKRLYGLCITLCKNPSDADDLYQDTWLRVVRHISKYDTEKEFEPWLTRICVNVYRSRLRRLARSPVRDGFSSSEEKDAVIGAAPATAADDYSALHDAIGRLPEKYKSTVILFYFRNMDIRASARALNIPEGTVKSRLHKAKKLLKEALRYETDLPF